MTTVRLTTALCLECEEPIELESGLFYGQVITCTTCRSEMEIIGLNPVKLEFFYDGDWDDDELVDDDGLVDDDEWEDY